MLIIEIIVETPETEFRIRKLTRDMLRGLQANADRPIKPGAIDIGDGPQLCFWVPTIFPDLAISLVAGAQNPVMQPLDGVGHSLPSVIRYLIYYPLEDSGLQISAKHRVSRDNIGGSPMHQKYLSLGDAYKAAQGAVRNDDIRTGNSIINAISQDPSTLYHEMTHYLDYVRAEGRMPDPSDAYNAALETDDQEKGTPGSAYYNSAVERNAFYNEMLHKLDRGRPEWFQQPFPRFMQRVMGWMRPDFINSLTPPNRQRLIQRLYQVWFSKQQNENA